MLLWPSGIQGGLRALGHTVRPAIASSLGRGRAKSEPSAGEADAESTKDEEVKASRP